MLMLIRGSCLLSLLLNCTVVLGATEQITAPVRLRLSDCYGAVNCICTVNYGAVKQQRGRGEGHEHYWL